MVTEYCDHNLANFDSVNSNNTQSRKITQPSTMKMSMSVSTVEILSKKATASKKGLITKVKPKRLQKKQQ